MGFCLVDLEYDGRISVPRFAKIENALRKHSVSRVLAMFVRFARVHTLLNKRFCCHKYNVALHVSLERSSEYSGRNRIA